MVANGSAQHDTQLMMHAHWNFSLLFTACFFHTSHSIFSPRPWRVFLIICIILSIKEPEAREWTVMTAINIHALLKDRQPQGVLRCANVLGVPSHGLLALHSLYIYSSTVGYVEYKWCKQHLDATISCEKVLSTSMWTSEQ